MARTFTTLRMLFFMGIFRKKFIWSNLEGLLLKGRLVEFVVSVNPYAWFCKFNQLIEKFGMQKSKSDHSIFSVFYRNFEAGIILLFVYFDDIVITRSDMTGI